MNCVLNSVRRQFSSRICKKTASRMAHQWGYASSELPPDQWYKDFPVAKGKNQSPIDLNSAVAKTKSFPPFQIHYHPSDVKSVSNNGHSVTFSASGGKSGLSGGPLQSKYTLEQFHFHWGADSSKGSEHLLDGKAYAAELHLVHWNSEKYSSFADSLAHPDGLCVLGVFLGAGESDNNAFKSVMDEISHVPCKDNAHTLASGLNPQTLLPADIASYFHYGGSLTTPPLKECVQWVVFKNPVMLSESQLSVFRNLHCGNSESSACLCDNYRPVQDICSRTVFST